MFSPGTRRTTSHGQHGFAHSAFSVVEMLVAMAVLVLLVALISQLFSSASLSSIASRKRIDSDSAARIALGIMASDFAKMVRRPDVDAIFAKIPGNDKVFFYSEAPGYLAPALAADKSTVSLVGYRINNTTFQFERLGKALSWSGTGSSLVFLNFGVAPTPSATPVPSTTLAGAWPATLGTTPNYNGVDDDYQIVSDAVFRFAFCFMDQSGKYFLPDVNTWRAWADDDNNGVLNLNEVRAVVLTVAVLEKTSRKIVPDMSKLAAALPDASITDLQASQPKLMAATWKEKIESPDFASLAGVPAPAAGAVRVYQRVIYLNGEN